MTTAKSPLLDQLNDLDEQIAAAKALPRNISQQQQTAKADLARLTEQLVEAFAANDTNLQAKLTEAKPKAEARIAEPWAERQAGARRAADRLTAERNQWVTANYRDLLAEITPEAMAAAEAIRTTVTDLQASVAHWSATAQRVAAIATAAGQHPDTMPRVDAIQNAVRELTRAMPEILPPLPRAAQTATFTPATSPDAEVRARAREALLNAGQG